MIYDKEKVIKYLKQKEVYSYRHESLIQLYLSNECEDILFQIDLKDKDLNLNITYLNTMIPTKDLIMKIVYLGDILEHIKEKFILGDDNNGND